MHMTYVPTGAVKPTGLLVLPAAAAVISAGLALPYALVSWYNPVMYLAPLWTLLWGWSVAGLLALVVRAWNMRHPVLVALLSGLGVTAGYAVSWVLWAELVLRQGEVVSWDGGRQVWEFTRSSLSLWPTLDLAMNPERLREVAALVYDEGLWRVWSWPLRGPALGLVWAAEALLFFIPALKGPVRQAGLPFSEATETWMTRRRLPRRAVVDLEADPNLAEALRNGDLTALLTAPAETRTKASRLILTLYRSASPEDYAFLDLTLVEVRDRRKQKPVALAEYLAVPPDLAAILVARYGGQGAAVVPAASAGAPAGGSEASASPSDR